MALSPAQQNAATMAISSLRAYQSRAYMSAYAAGVLPGQDDASHSAELKNISDFVARIDQLEGPLLARVSNGEQDFQWWSDAAVSLHSDLEYQSGLADSFDAWDILKSATAATVSTVATTVSNVALPAVGITVGIVALVAAAYLVFTVRR